jgi:hypothetical protein
VVKSKQLQANAFVFDSSIEGTVFADIDRDGRRTPNFVSKRRFDRPVLQRTGDHFAAPNPVTYSPQSGKLAKIFFGFFGTETRRVTGHLHILLNDVWLEI